MTLTVRDVTKSYEDYTVLEGISFDVDDGETFVIIGGSGSGKSTLLNIVAGILDPDSGSVEYNGESIGEMTQEQFDETRKEWGFCFQNGALLGSLTVAENVALPIKEHSELAQEVIENMVKIKLDMVGLTGFGDRYPDELSGGMVKRAALARALALDPEVLFCDEPGSGLDPVMSAAINKLILDLTGERDLSALMVTHSMETAFTVADRMMLLHEGKAIVTGTPQEVRDSTDPLVEQFVEGKPDGPIPLRQNREQFIQEMLGEETERQRETGTSS